MILPYPTGCKNLFQTFSRKGAYPAARFVILNSGKISAEMIFLAAGKIFQSVFVFNGNDNPASGCQVLLNHI